jgi:hypothetical protein
MGRWSGLGCLVVMLASGMARAAPPAPLQLEVAGAGEVVAQDVGEAKLLPGNLAGVTGVTSPKLIHPGHRIDGAYCRQFGFSFHATNLAPGVSAPVTVQVTHPLWRLPDGRSGTVEMWTSVLEGNRWSYVGYSFTEAWSLVPGTWTFTVSQDGRVLTEQSFQLDVAPGQTMPLQGCDPSIS